MFRLLHLSDPHLGPLPIVGMRDLAGKRLTGYVNYRRNRNRSHDMGILDKVVADIKTQPVDHIVCTGDIANIGLVGEFPLARSFLEKLGSPHEVSFVPGNHDAYVKGALDGLSEYVGDWMTGDSLEKNTTARFPYVRRRGLVGLVGLSSAVPKPPFIASGTVGKEQMSQAENILRQLKSEGLFRIILIHHPPYRGLTTGRGLTDAPAFEEMLRRAGAELILHGHNHTTQLTWRKGAEGPVPILGVSSASSSSGSKNITRHAGYHVYQISGESGRWKVQGHPRRLNTDGVIEAGKPFELG